MGSRTFHETIDTPEQGSLNGCEAELIDDKLSLVGKLWNCG